MMIMIDDIERAKYIIYSPADGYRSCFLFRRWWEFG